MNYSRYPAYKDSGVEWLGDIPSHWETVAVRRHFAVDLGKMLNLSKQDGSGTPKPYLRAANIHWDRVDLSDVNTMEFSDSQLERYRLQPGDLLVTEGGVTVGRSAIWNGESAECYYQNSLNRARVLPGSPLTTRYLLYWMYFTTACGFVDLVAEKATFGHLTNEKLMAFPLVAPPNLHEQAAITTFLDRETAKIDTLIAKQERLIALLQEKRQALISHAVTKGLNPDAPMKESGVEWLGQVPSHWKVKKVKHVASVGNGSTPSRVEPSYWENGDQPWLTSGKINEHIINEADEYVTLRAIKECHLPYVSPQSLLIALTGEGKTRGSVALVQFPTTISQHIACLRFDISQALPEYMLLYFDSLYEYLRFESIAAGSTKAAITCEQLGLTPCLIPPVEEQRAIIDTISTKINQLSRLSEANSLSIQRLLERRAVLISAAVTGKIDVRGL